MASRYLPGQGPLEGARRRVRRRLRRRGLDEVPLTEPQRFLHELPVMHFRTGVTPHSGGLNPVIGQVIIDEVARLDHPAVVETGSGASTLLFLMLGCREVVAVNPDPAIAGRIEEEAASRGLDTSGLRCLQQRSELALAQLALDGHRCDVAFIDGNHGWPSVFVDFCYLNMMLRSGGVVFIDDIQLYSCDQLVRLLAAQPDFEQVPARGKLAAFRKHTDSQFLPDWVGEPFILEQTHPRFRPRSPSGTATRDMGT